MQWNNDIAVGLTARHVARSLASIWPNNGVITHCWTWANALINAVQKERETFKTQSLNHDILSC